MTESQQAFCGVAYIAVMIIALIGSKPGSRYRCRYLTSTVKFKGRWTTHSHRRNGQQVVQNHCQVSRIGAPIFEEVIVAPRKIKAAVRPLESQEIVVGAICRGMVARNLKLACSRKSLGENSSVIGDITMPVAALEVRTSVLCLPFAQKAQQSSYNR